ncbi:MAG: ferritin-like domain-containing protein [Bdellovibrionales bacterium]
MNAIAMKDFIAQLESGNEALFKASEIQVEAFFKSNPSSEALIEHFSGRCANEYMNMIEVAQRLLEIAPSGDRKMVKLLARQVLDEAQHFDMVAKVLERITGRPLDVEALLQREAGGGSAKGARILESMDREDRLALHLYQFIAEGRAHRVWQRMAEVCPDPMIAETYAKIAADEKVHREFGRVGLEQFLNDESDRARALDLASQIRKELYEISCMNCVEVPEARALCVDAYGPEYLKH